MARRGRGAGAWRSEGSKDVEELVKRTNAGLSALEFSVPWVYNPWEYAGEAYLEYWRRYGQGRKKAVLLGMNPGPWGMAQTGVPFGEVEMVRDWLGISAPIGQPPRSHPKRPIQGWACPRSEVSGRRLWGFLKDHFQTPQRFFEWGYVANYCPLVFMDEGGANVTPDKLLKSEREPLLELCDRALLAHLEKLQPEKLIGVGKWAEGQARSLAAKYKLGIPVLSVPHPSPANPAANRGWGRELTELLP